MSFKDELRDLLKSESGKAAQEAANRQQWEKVREEVVRPVFEAVVEVAEERPDLKAQSLRENGANVLTLGSVGSERQLRFEPEDKSHARVACSCPLISTSKELFDLARLDRETVEAKVRAFLAAYLDGLRR